ncbi:class I SAM-dependent methyltransferase [Defluviimonas sp. WL0075]|uniref:Class I SAM-dependent methyltransferase n=1 Tax=Albidovulum sediminicola TaxID=2984331 RepID=A0ABT2Z441_9RHOB|nr:class I SAM-dependent methyltransferase [Defluviimonas sp. WL0075]MCV2865835.1 class I SAM-dependent methyltransferase [Defluviimonas sp. WL0075]
MVQYLNRMVYQQVTGAWMREIGAQDLDAVEISGTRSMRYGFRSHRNYAFPDYDICDTPFIDPDGTPVRADIILAEQVWEHLDRPYRATRNVYEMLNPGGYFWLAAPFFCRIHGVPVDCSRWTARGLKNLLIECGFDEDRIVARQWGNKECALGDMEPKWAIYEPGKSSLANQPRWPVMAWALAQKAGPEQKQIDVERLAAMT